MRLQNKFSMLNLSDLRRTLGNKREIRIEGKSISTVYVAISFLALTVIGLVLLRSQSNVGVPVPSSYFRGTRKISAHTGTDPLVIFPRYLKEGSSEQELIDFYRANLNPDKNRDIKAVKYEGGESSSIKSFGGSKYHDHDISLNHDGTAISGDLSQCSKIEKKIKVGLGEKNELKSDYKVMIRKLMQQIKDEEAFFELNEIFKKELQKQIDEDSLGFYWYRFAGTSVWLKDYGVHFMVSRVVYSPTASKKAPLMSLMYAQVFNEKWEELNDVELVIPVHDALTKESSLENVAFPRFLAIPTYVSSVFTKRRYYGPEDARIMLTQDEYGRDQPVLVYNSYHRKVVEEEVSVEDSAVVKFGYYRSMFLCFPFQFQKGKVNIEGMANPKFNHVRYNRALELRRENYERERVQKNWTPFISVKERQETGYDKHIYFVYRWEGLEILKCELGGFHNPTSRCVFEYKANKGTLGSEPIGPLRGGTEMWNLGDIDLRLLPMVDSGTEVWIGFARAHLRKCGCGKDMYRPNLAIITKRNGEYVITHLSSFISLDMEVFGWTDPNLLCHPKEPNALIPNGISSWEVTDLSLRKKQVIDDHLVLTVSIADATTNLVKIKGLLAAITQEFSLGSESYNNSEDIVKCALKSSSDLCAAYGQEQAKLGKAHKNGVPKAEPNKNKDEGRDKKS